jgi:flagellar basal body-associated protein FliL
MKKKKIFIIIFSIPIFIFLVFTFSIFFWKGRVEIKKEETITDFSNSLIPEEIRPIKETHRYFNYKGERIYICKIIFSDEKKAEDFYKFMEENEAKIKENKFEKVSVNFGNFSGSKFIYHNIQNSQIAFLLRNGEIVIIANGKNEKNLDKIIPWFLKRY